MRRAIRFLILISTAIAATAQSALPEFEVASIRPSRSKFIGLSTYPGGRIVASDCTVRYLIMEAFRLQDFQISGGPHWIDEERFDIEARPPASSASAKSNPFSSKLPPNDEQCQMLQALLIQRFQLKFHRDTTEGKIYTLTAGSGKLRLQAAKDAHEFPWAGGIEGGLPMGGGLRGMNITMPQLAARIASWIGRPVIDKTGLQGAFDFEYRMEETDPGSNTDRVSSIITSLNAIGLKLKDARGPVETLVIDGVERPSEN